MGSLLNERPRPTAAFIASDTVALGALHAVRRHGLRVPHDFAVVGFDDIPLASFLDPPLTTVRLPAYALGWAAADLLIRLISGEETDSSAQLTLETELVLRDSSGARENDKREEEALPISDA
jgi:LacI family transcriptional regulator